MSDGLTSDDGADDLTTEAGVVAFLVAASESDDPDHMLAALAIVAKARNKAQLARDAGLTREGLYKALLPGAKPSFAVVARVARALGVGIAFRPMTPTPRQEEGVMLHGSSQE